MTIYSYVQIFIIMSLYSFLNQDDTVIVFPNAPQNSIGSIPTPVRKRMISLSPIS